MPPNRAAPSEPAPMSVAPLLGSIPVVRPGDGLRLLADDLRLLVVDDEPALGSLVREAAEDVGYEVFVTKNPDAFVERARIWSPTALLLDLGMPGTDGIELLRGLAADGCAGHVMLMSGADDKVIEAAMQLGRERGLKMGGVVQRPVTYEKLRDLLASLQPSPKTLQTADLAEAIAADQL